MLVAAAVVAGALGVAAPSVFACSCVRQHPAMFLPHADAAVVGVVESRLATNGNVSHVLRIERAIKGTVGERVTVESGLSSCQVSLQVGARVGLFLNRGLYGEWSATTCSVTDADALLAAAELPAPRGVASLVAAVDADAADGVALTAGGRVAGYSLADGKPLALASCGSGTVQATRGPDGRLWISRRVLPRLSADGARELPLDDVAALGCTDGGRTLWAAGRAGDEMELISFAGTGEPRRVMRRPASAAVIAGSNAYFAHPGLLRVVPLTGGRPPRTTRQKSQFVQLSVQGERVAGRLRDGRAALLHLRSGVMRTGGRVDGLVWLGRDRLLAAGNGAVLDTRLRVARRLSGPLGRVVGTDGASAYLASGNLIRRLRSGAKRARTFAELPGPAVGVVPVRTEASAAWHSCEESAKAPLTT